MLVIVIDGVLVAEEYLLNGYTTVCSSSQLLKGIWMIPGLGFCR